MNAIEQARTAYNSPNAALRTAQSIEYDAIARVTRNLAASDPRKDFPALAQALFENRRLWTRLGVYVADPSNGLPNDLRARLFYLAQFTEVTSRKILGGEADKDILVEINTSVMAGLRAQGATA